MNGCLSNCSQVVDFVRCKPANAAAEHESIKGGNVSMKLSKKFIEENVFYLKTGKRHRVCYDELCKSCKNECKQSYKIVAISCPCYISKKLVI